MIINDDLVAAFKMLDITVTLDALHEIAVDDIYNFATSKFYKKDKISATEVRYISERLHFAIEQVERSRTDLSKRFLDQTRHHLEANVRVAFYDLAEFIRTQTPDNRAGRQATRKLETIMHEVIRGLNDND